jgi:hypothetical protein
METPLPQIVSKNNHQSSAGSAIGVHDESA